MRCASCKGAAHPATGHQHSAKILICGPCARRWNAWLQSQTKRRFRIGAKGSKRYTTFYGRDGIKKAGPNP